VSAYGRVGGGFKQKSGRFLKHQSSLVIGVNIARSMRTRRHPNKVFANTDTPKRGHADTSPPL
jgi:hypothetical protein